MSNISHGTIIMYQTVDGLTKVDVQLHNETVWLSLDQIAALFQRNKSTISRHIRNIFTEGELERSAVVANFATTASDGKKYQIDYYNLDVIISIGYRIKSLRGTQFRIWANTIIKEYIIKGFAMNDDMLKNIGGGNYFDELLARIRDIRSSEKVFYRKVLDIYATSIDYNPRADETKRFFQSVQNKMHYAVHGKTAAEVIHKRVDGDKPFARMTTWRGELPVESDALVAKNYLTRDEIETLNRIVTLYLEFAELQAKEQIPMYMKDWLEKLDAFLTLTRKDILNHAGKISHEVAQRKAKDEFEKYRKRTLEEITTAEIDYLNFLDEAQKKLENN